MPTRLARSEHPTADIPPSRLRRLLRRFLALLEPLLAVLYWPCLSAKSDLQDTQANREDGDR